MFELFVVIRGLMYSSAPSHSPHLCSVVMSFFTIVVASGMWTSPGDSEEIAAALSQALRNCIERSFILTHLLIICCVIWLFLLKANLPGIGRALTGLSYMRFGDVFTKYHYAQSEELFRFLFNSCQLHVIFLLCRCCGLQHKNSWLCYYVMRTLVQSYILVSPVHYECMRAV